MTLYAHQTEAIEFAIKQGGRAAIFHHPGLGKTLTALEIFQRFKADEPELRLLVVCPKSLVNTAWGGDIAKFTPLDYLPIAKATDIETNPLPSVVIINYEKLISKSYPVRKMLKGPWMCVVDESSRMKNNKSLTTKTLLKLHELFKYRIVMSGSPMPNCELELWGQINFIRPWRMHPSFYAFRNTFFHMQRGSARMDLHGQTLTRQEYKEIFRHGWKYEITDFNRSRLMDIVRPVSHWRKKSECLDLPDRTDEIREVTLNKEEWRCYREMEKEAIMEIKGKQIVAMAQITKIMKLREVASGFAYTEAGETVEIGRSKLKELLATLEELGDQQVIIWCQFRHEVEQVVKSLKSTVTLYSKTKDHDQSVRDFQMGRARYLIAHPLSGSHGLTFINCSTMVFYSLDYSYESHFQARERIHRIGQDKKCLYIYLKAMNTVDDQLINVLGGKQTIQDAVYEIIRRGR